MGAPQARLGQYRFSTVSGMRLWQRTWGRAFQ
jgi:hypothetical protein